MNTLTIALSTNSICSGFKCPRYAFNLFLSIALICSTRIIESFFKNLFLLIGICVGNSILFNTVVIGTTNLEDEKIAQLQEISKNIPILISSNFSTGIYLLEKMFKENKNILSLFDKEIIETHHKDKIHSPSGTSLALADCLNTANITSIRIGDVVGVHEVILEKDYEVLSINHSVNNRCVYAIGAVNAARWLINKENGLYSFGNLYES